MRLPQLSDILFVPLEDPILAAPVDVLVLGAGLAGEPPAEPAIAAAVVAPAARQPDAAVAVAAVPEAASAVMVAAVPEAAPPAPVAVPEAVPTAAVAAVLEPDVAVPAAEPVADPPAFALPPEDAFPTLAELNAILTANAGPPAGPNAAERAEAIALLGLDPAIAADPDLYAAIIAGLPAPDADEILAQWLNEAEVPPCEWDAAPGDWQIG